MLMKDVFLHGLYGWNTKSECWNTDRACELVRLIYLVLFWEVIIAQKTS